ncbi:hypothetical protein WQE_32886 [Paraburkholderia hospita]|uniref:Uncharacterized protein n=1 Tax=Paraburkholderia hospita TaxID=169430 RepID=A0ABP2PHM6_9BURK|nr:hypothetical protein [Paraburkholderia hospita]EIM96717.1 hypothetical protein WQE_32886 [Paraburkholderia hospita]OUL87877.1 hypothetical protein CA602_12760 [Paraburkholderia hospita]
MTTYTFGKLFGGLFSEAADASRPAAYSTPSQASPIEVGRGGDNERQVVIAGEARLFRDEGDVVVQFHPAFDYELRETPVGMKLIPSLEPHWAVLSEHKSSMRDAIGDAIRSARANSAEDVAASAQGSGTPEALRPSSRVRAASAQSQPPLVIDNAPELESSAKVPGARRSERPRYGVVREWGEKEFPDGKRPGKTYVSFCLTLEHRGEQQVLQGEGLREAIAEARCGTGDRVEVRRLGKTKVPAVDKDGQPKLDASGAQILWDKWLWSITKK